MAEAAKPRKAGSRKPNASRKRRNSAAPSDSTDGFSATPSTDPTNPLKLESEPWQPPEHPTPAEAEVVDEYEAPPPEILEWTPERAGSIVKAGGYLLHVADGLSREPEGKDLWKATEDDIEAIAPPLARILNRYEPARRLAGLSDEGELAFGMIAYARKNLVERGRVAGAKRGREEALEDQQAETWPRTDPNAPPPAT